MRITCPDCGASYDVPETMLAAGRPVRCARCSSEWVPLAGPDPQAPDLPAHDPHAPDLQPHDRPAAPDPAWPAQPVGEATLLEPGTAAAPAADSAARLVAMSPPAWRNPNPAAPPAPPPRGQRLALAGWAVTLLVLAAALWGAYAAREPIMRAWPPSTRLYAALGLAG